MDAAGDVLDDEHDVQPLEQQGVDAEEVGGENAVCLGGQELSPGGVAAAGRGVDAAVWAAATGSAPPGTTCAPSHRHAASVMTGLCHTIFLRRRQGRRGAVNRWPADYAWSTAGGSGSSIRGMVGGCPFRRRPARLWQISTFPYLEARAPRDRKELSG